MEFHIDLKSSFAVHQKNETFQSFAPNKQNGLQWTSKYGYVSVIPFGLDKPVDGLNEKGLSLSALWLQESQYMQIEHPEKAVDLQDFGSWILGNFATVEELKKSLTSIEVWSSVNEKIGSIPSIHFAIHDASGKSLVIEFLEGKMHVHDNPLSVLTNSPRFDYHLNNLRNYLHLSPTSVKPLEVKELSLTPFGSGGAFLGMPGDWTSPSRFVRLFYMKHFADKPQNNDQAMNLAFHLLNALDITRGLVHWNGKTADYTQWIVVKDLKQLKIYYRTYENQMVKMIDVMKEIGQKETPATPISFSS